MSYDEKLGVQAIGNTVEDRPPIPNAGKTNPAWQDCEYACFGILSLLAAIGLLTRKRYRLSAQTIKTLILILTIKVNQTQPK